MSEQKKVNLAKSEEGDNWKQPAGGVSLEDIREIKKRIMPPRLHIDFRPKPCFECDVIARIAEERTEAGR